MDWIRAALTNDANNYYYYYKNGNDVETTVNSSSIDELQEAIDATRAELQRVQTLGAAIKKRHVLELTNLTTEKQLRNNDLIAFTKVAQQHIPFWEYAKVVRMSFAADKLKHTWFGWCEAWLLRNIHHAMMSKKQLTIVQKDCNRMLMDLYQTIPVIKEEKLLGDAIAMRNLCKADESSKTLKENYLQYEGYQRKIICKLTNLSSLQPGMSVDATLDLVSASCDDDLVAEKRPSRSDDRISTAKRPSLGNSSTSSAARRAARSSSLGKRPPESNNNKNDMAALNEADCAPADPTVNGEEDYLSELTIGTPIKMIYRV
jgi:hypothetical protein